ncbi:hypothetical protein T310_0802 [Rasamsonia emersonii CBS 393.64]|uniref:Inner kinetochore subunit AME1 domain-containing protein n=1 Tax=Rasamsonia emersonii (strain ATCC 16479 / CBS 393.64 / IMI 116815) TaxID=1408163 RepID=A0A0F4Z3T6_RASE3|nr:hypothetical protein T310_0802 [Rasamsonia emersonii CBS 393.64]KKA25162.1 hypothetical protein T310_0802 [Rasamsonia emersonii CBS 393.64]
MRQRGAGTRKIKDVDFGFSFGSPVAAAPQQPSRQSPQPAPAPPAGLGPAEQPQTPERQKPAPQLSPNKAPEGSQGHAEPIRTPGSSRNRLPERPSTFDIPLDEEQFRSNKRRRIGTASTVLEDAPAPLLENAQAEHSAPPTQDATTNDNSVQPDGETASIPAATPHINGSQSQDASDQIPAPEQQDTGAFDQTTIPDTEAKATTENDKQNLLENGESVRDERQKNKRAIRKPIPQQPPDREQSVEKVHDQENWKVVTEQTTEVPSPEIPADAPAEEAKENGDSPQSRGTRRRRAGDDTAEETGQENGEIEDQATRRKPSRRKARQEQISQEDKNDAPPEPPVVQKETSQESEEIEDNTARRRRGRRKAHQEEISQGKDENDAPPEPPVVQKEPAAPASAEVPEAEPDRQEADQEERGSAERPPKRRKQRQKQAQNADDRVTTRARRSVENVPEKPEPEPEPEPEQEPASTEQQTQVDQPQAEAREPELSQKRRGRPSGSKTGAGKSKQRNRQSSAQGEEAEADGESKRRGETVPVTVHRLANVTALDSLADDSANSSSDEESADELSTRKKFPNRGGVNPADVLSQICRETLEKTLTTLKNGIANESNPARRSEWTRKRKAVEAYGAELEGRLFELSEMLDSNFVLSVQLKKAKREMADLRNRLLQVRQQRQEIALRMDEVRRKHNEEESEKMSRNTINNSLHNLELALDRNKVRNVDETSEAGEDSSSRSASSIAGLEFLLRTVADNVSSIAPGAQGGLLNQVKAFNAQLEMALKRLENK